MPPKPRAEGAKAPSRYLFIDTETTDLLKISGMPLEKQPHIIEYAGLVTDNTGKLIDELVFLCRPPVASEPAALRTHGITEESLENEKPFQFHQIKLMKQLGSCEYIVAHNLAFDLGVVKAEFERLGVDLILPKRRICTVEQTMNIRNYRMRLADLYKYLFEESFPEAHRARNDCAALAKCFWELRKRGFI